MTAGAADTIAPPPAEFVRAVVQQGHPEAATLAAATRRRYDAVLLNALSDQRDASDADPAVLPALAACYAPARRTGTWSPRNPFLEAYVLHRGFQRSSLWSAIARRELRQERASHDEAAGHRWRLTHADGQHISVEHDCRLPLPHAAALAGQYRALSPPLLDAVAEALAVALDRIEPVARLADLFWHGTRMLSLRADDLSSRYYSASFEALPGLSVLYVPGDAASVDGDRLLDSLVHEAVHGLLYAYEAVCGPLLAPPDAREDPLISPWSGQPLRPNAAVQACVVWAVLAQTWATLDGPAHPLCARARAGFASSDYAPFVGGVADRLDPGVATVLRQLSDLIDQAAIEPHPEGARPRLPPRENTVSMRSPRW